MLHRFSPLSLKTVTHADLYVPSRHLTLAVSRRAMYGTRMPQSDHWRGRLHCFVRPGAVPKSMD